MDVVSIIYPVLMGLPQADYTAGQDEIFGSAYASVAYLKYNLKFPKNKKVYVLGERGLEEELELEGIQYAGGTVSRPLRMRRVRSGADLIGIWRPRTQRRTSSSQAWTSSVENSIFRRDDSADSN